MNVSSLFCFYIMNEQKINKGPRDQLFLIGMVASMFCWGLSWASGKILTEYGNPVTIAFYRFLLTFISMVFLVLFLKENFSIKRRGFIDLAGAAGCLSFYTFLFFKGLSSGKAGAGGVLVTVLNPIISYVIMLIRNKRFPDKKESLGLFIGLLAGMILLNVIQNGLNLYSAGNLYFVMASLTWAFLSIFTSKSSHHGSPVIFSFYMYGIGAVVMFALADFSNVTQVLYKSDLIFIINLIFSATITTAIATTFYFYATSRIGPSRASSFIFLVPFSAALGGWLFLSEIPQLHTIIGGLLGMVAVYVLNRK